MIKTFLRSRLPNPSGGMIMSACLLVPLIGCAMAVIFKSALWLFLLVPLLVFMEGGILLIGLAIVAVSYLMRG